MDDKAKVYLQHFPENSEELRNQINSAIRASRQWLGVAKISAEDSVMVEAQIFWLEQLINISDIKLKK